MKSTVPRNYVAQIHDAIFHSRGHYPRSWEFSDELKRRFSYSASDQRARGVWDEKITPRIPALFRALELSTKYGHRGQRVRMIKQEKQAIAQAIREFIQMKKLSAKK